MECRLFIDLFRRSVAIKGKFKEDKADGEKSHTFNVQFNASGQIASKDINKDFVMPTIILYGILLNVLPYYPIVLQSS